MTGDVCFRGRYRHPIPRTSRRLLRFRTFENGHPYGVDGVNWPRIFGFARQLSATRWLCSVRSSVLL